MKIYFDTLSLDTSNLNHLSSNGDNAILVQRWCQIIKESARLDATEIS